MSDKLKDILKLSPNFWMQTGLKIKRLVLEDSINGNLPSGTSTYRSATYQDYKASGMKRKRDGKRLSGYSGTRINTNVGAVNMNLTGELWRGFHPEAATNFSIDMAFKERHKSIGKGGKRNSIDTSKILEGNVDVDPKRDLLTLSEKNQQVVFEMIEKELDNRLVEWSRKDVIKIIKA